MRLTNVQKYQQILAEVNEKVQEYVDSLFPDGRPSRIYIIEGADFQISDHTIDEWGYSHAMPLRHNEKPTRVDIALAREHADNFQPNSQNVMVRYSGLLNYGGRIGGKFSAAKHLNDVQKGERLSFVREPLEAQSIALRDIYIPKEGEIKCRYCGKAFPEQNVHVGKIISYANYGPAGRTYKYCSPTCHTYDQFAHEG